MQWPVSAAAVIERDGSVLLALHDQAGWELPGGQVERGEEPADAVVRGVREETGLRVTTTALLGVRVWEVAPGRPVLTVGFACRVPASSTLSLSPAHLAWHALDRLDELALPAIHRELIAGAVRGRIVLLGDSHLAKFNRARIHRLQHSLGGGRVVVNHAYGGATALDLLPQLEQIASHPGDILVVSVGTNDLARWKQVPLPRFRQAVLDVLRHTASHRTIFVLPPPLDPIRQHAARPTQVRTPDEQLLYLDELIALTRAGTVETIALPADDIHDTDGVHLNEHGYDLLIAALAQLLNTP